jgi:hypothetical protein
VIKQICLTALVFLLLAQSVEAMNLGTVIKQGMQTVTVGESAKFTILFWNSEYETYKVRLEADDVPEDWQVIIQPEEFLLDANTGSEQLVVGSKSVNVLPVNIFIKPTSAGTYSISIKAVAGMPNGQINFFQERRFLLNLAVIGAEEKPEVNKPSATNIPMQPTGNMPKPAGNQQHLLQILLVVCILVFSLLIYKYA